jgi:hypothetical protein
MVWESERVGGADVALIPVVGLESGADAGRGGCSASCATSWLACWLSRDRLVGQRFGVLGLS